MADFSKFRSSLGGFNRGDVATYIETLCRTHGAELKERDGRIESLTAALAEAQGQREEAVARAEALRRQVEELEAQLEAATAPPPEEDEALEEARSEDAADETEVPDYPTLELEAYRRAEATERLASQRAQQLKRELVDFLENTTARYQQTGEDIAALAEVGWAYDRRDINDFRRRMENLRKIYERCGYRYAPYFFEKPVAGE